MTGFLYRLAERAMGTAQPLRKVSSTLFAPTLTEEVSRPADTMAAATVEVTPSTPVQTVAEPVQPGRNRAQTVSMKSAQRRETATTGGETAVDPAVTAHSQAVLENPTVLQQTWPNLYQPAGRHQAADSRAERAGCRAKPRHRGPDPVRSAGPSAPENGCGTSRTAASAPDSVSQHRAIAATGSAGASAVPRYREREHCQPGKPSRRHGRGNHRGPRQHRPYRSDGGA